MSRSTISRSALIVSGLLALMLGGCMGGPGSGQASLGRSFADGSRGVSVPTRLSAGGRSASPSSLLILGVN